jgi:glycosyltransferase involved in cell wall biosynthesis
LDIYKVTDKQEVFDFLDNPIDFCRFCDLGKSKVGIKWSVSSYKKEEWICNKKVPQPLVTIVLPVYNVEPYLQKCLDSIVNQTVQNIQIICVNDGSTDGSHAILEEYAAKDSRFTILTQKNQGAGSARNAAYPHIKGKYTFFADADDWLELNLCEKVLQRLEETAADIVYFDVFKGRGDETTHISDDCENAGHRFYFIRHVTPPWHKVWRTEFLLKNDIKFLEDRDHEFSLPFNDDFINWKGCVLAGKIAVLNEPLYHYHAKRPGSLWNKKTGRFLGTVNTINAVKEMLVETKKFEEYQDTLTWWSIRKIKIVWKGKLLSEFRDAFVRSFNKLDDPMLGHHAIRSETT